MSTDGDSSAFDVAPCRIGRNSLKWGKYEGKDILPLWVADMDFESPKEVVEAAMQASSFGNFGYGRCPDSLVDAVVERCRILYDWEIEKSWIVWLPGMVCALNVCCRVCRDASQVITQTPIYPPFLTAPGNFDLVCTRLPMILKDERFTLDFDSLDELYTQPGDLFMLCHPHNPVGTVFTREELAKLSNWIVERSLVLCSDEIHCDLILDAAQKHQPFASIDSLIADRAITLMAPSKTFNLPGFGCSYAIISNGELRRKFKRCMSGIVPDPPAMSFSLTEAAYRSGEGWRTNLLAYLTGNRNLAVEELKKHSKLEVYSPEATYLLWIDATKLPISNPHRYFETKGVGLSDGRDFGAPGFLRLNFGCTRSLLQKALDRMDHALSELS